MAVDIFPVVHVQSPEQAVEQSHLAIESGADGVFLIDHSNEQNTSTLVSSFNMVAMLHPDRYIGLNFLQHPSAAHSLSFLAAQRDAGRLLRMPDGLWTDNADVDAPGFLNMRTEHPELAGVEYFGGVAFKYTSLFTNDPEAAEAEAVRMEPFVDVVTTSGAGTGRAPTPEKIEAMKTAISKPLAVASGISTENLADYGDNIDRLLVSTSVETAPYSGIFDTVKLETLISLAHKG